MSDLGPDWKRIAIFSESLLSCFADYSNLKRYSRNFTCEGEGGNEIEQREYRCKWRSDTGCPILMHAKQASFGSEDFFVRMKGKHNCGFAISVENIQQDNNKHTSQMKRINNATANAKSPVVVGETSRITRSMAQKSVIAIQELPDGDEGPQQMPEPENDIASEVGVLQIHPGHNRLDINDNQPGPKERSQKLSQLADQMGLKFSALIVENMSTEKYFITADKVKSKIATTSFRTSTNNLTTLVLEVHPQPRGPPLAILLCKNGVRGTSDSKLGWPIPDFGHFFWAIRGLCHEIFFISKREQNLTDVPVLGHNSNSGAINDSIVLPEVLEPGDEDNEEERSEENKNKTNRAQNHRDCFSIVDSHKELRVEGLIQDIQLMLHSFGYAADRTAKLIITNNQASKKTQNGPRLIFTETDTHVKVAQESSKKTKKSVEVEVDDEYWPKITRTHFRYALLGKAMNVFYRE